MISDVNNFQQTIPDQAEDFDILPFPYEDEIDAALAPDFRVATMEENLDDVEIDEPDDDFDDSVEFDSDDDIEDVSDEDYDAEDLKDSENELISNPFEDDDMIDAAIGDDEAVADDIEDEF